MSLDDKSRVPLGITAANVQSSMLMHLEYRVTLPDWVVVERYELISSVYAGINITANGVGDPSCATYFGPTLILIRSGKHCSSTAKTHVEDLKELLTLTSSH